MHLGKKNQRRINVIESWIIQQVKMAKSSTKQYMTQFVAHHMQETWELEVTEGVHKISYPN